MTLDQDDFLTYHLYNASKTPQIKRARMRNWILTSVAFFCLAYLFYTEDNNFLSVYFLICGCLSVILHPLYSRWRYKRHYLKHIQQAYKNEFGKTSSLDITEDVIVAKDGGSEIKMNTNELAAINEIRDYYFIKTKSGSGFIISKAKADNPDRIKAAIDALVTRKEIPHNVELDWKWR